MPYRSNSRLSGGREISGLVRPAATTGQRSPERSANTALKPRRGQLRINAVKRTLITILRTWNQDTPQNTVPAPLRHSVTLSRFV
jgi:hypothetical protein